LRLGFEAVAGVEERGEVRIDGFQRAKIAVQKLADHFAEPRIVLGEASGVDVVAARFESKCQQFDLGAFAAAIDAFDGDKLSG